MYRQVKATTIKLFHNSKVQVAFILITAAVMVLGSGAPHNFGG